MMPSIKTLLLLVMAAIVGALAALIWQSQIGAPAMVETGGVTAKEPLYWVAPMDSNYRRDSAGKSPMGMDLVPVYAIDDDAPGIVKISPEVINNLGVRTAVASMKNMQADIRTVGYVQYDQDNLVHIHPRVEGWVEKLYVKAAGNPVLKGQPLYDLYSPQLVNAQEELVLSLRRDSSRLVQAAEDRLLALQLSKGFVDRLKRDQEVHQTVTFTAPQSGVMDSLNIREGFFVGPKTTLMSIGALDNVWVEAEVFERQAASLEEGLSVTMWLDYLPGKQWTGRIDYVYPSLDEETRTLRVRLRFNNEGGELRPNMFAQVIIHADAGDETLVVPREALIRTGEQDRVVLALGEGRFKSIAVRSGRYSSEYAEILDGLNPGDTVVASAQFLLDSESSRTSDFKRMHRESMNTSDRQEMADPVGHSHD
ncbi:MAG: Cu(I)/Ag(I) efflux system membrane fusion protein [Halieaceae bacterium]|jgi:Cu(I)/Ag(I) efflux system membrane fusion protein